MAEKSQDTPQTDWEDEGGSLAPEPKQRTRNGLEIPVPKRKDFTDALKKMARSMKRKR